MLLQQMQADARTLHPAVHSCHALNHGDLLTVLAQRFNLLLASINRRMQMFHTVSHADALRCLHKAVGYYTDLGRLGMAARNLWVSVLHSLCNNWQAEAGHACPAYSCCNLVLLNTVTMYRAPCFFCSPAWYLFGQ